jgi:hypothetical protein
MTTCTECGAYVNTYGECDCTGYATTEFAESQATAADWAVWSSQDR